MWNNQKINMDWKLCFICQEQVKNKLRSRTYGIKPLSSNLLGFWQLGVLDITCSSVISTLHDEAELENYLAEKEAKYNKPQITRRVFQKQTIQLNLVLLFPVHFKRKKAWCCPVLSATKKFYQRTSMLLALVMLKGKQLMFNTTNISQKNGKKCSDSDNPRLLALISTGDSVANKIFYQTSCYKSMQYNSDRFKQDKSSTDWNVE